MSRLSRLQAKGLQKAGDIMIPGDEVLPSFTRSGSIAAADRIVEFLTESDRAGLKGVAVLFAILPRPFVKGLLWLAANANRLPSFLAPPFRELNLGVKGVVMSLYYSDVSMDRKIQGALGYDAKVAGESGDTNVEEAYGRLRAAQSAVRSLSVRDRLDFIRRLREAILAKREWIVDQIQDATGKSRTDALTSEIFGTLDHLLFLEKYAEKHLREKKVPTPPVLMGKKSLVRFEPLGTVLVISPWNYPFYQAIVPITSAFVCGNTVAYKPSEYTPLNGVVEAVLADAGFNEDWIRVFYGAGDVGSKLIDQKPGKIFFTGSTSTGKKIMAQASRDLIPVELELGGKDPMIVFADANIERAVAGAAWGALTNTGQSCTSVEKIIVEDAIYDDFRDRLVKEVSRLKLGVDRDGGADLGLMTNDMQTKIVADHLVDAEKKGARVLVGSEWDRKSRAIPPLVFDGVTREMKVYREESFGPVLPLLRFKSEAEAIELANDTEYGLSASVWSKDLVRASRVADAIVTGNVSVNNVMITEGNHALPFGGVKNSGFGRFKGEWGLAAFSNVKAIMIEASSKKIEANWYPYTPEKYSKFNDLITAVFGSQGFVGFVKFAIAGLKLESYVAKVRSDRVR
ncbi:MAG: aldehyde dehydrogenase family protein [Bdellovibrionota bacterium]